MSPTLSPATNSEPVPLPDKTSVLSERSMEPVEDGCDSTLHFALPRIVIEPSMSDILTSLP